MTDAPPNTSKSTAPVETESTEDFGEEETPTAPALANDVRAFNDGIAAYAASPETLVTYPTEAQAKAVEIVVAVRTLRDLCTAENVQAVFAATDMLSQDARELRAESNYEEAAWTDAAAQFLLLSMRSEEEPNLPLEPEEHNEPDLDDSEVEIVEPEQPTTPATPAT